MYTLYGSPSAAGTAIHWMLLELGVPFEVKLLDFDKAEHKTPMCKPCHKQLHALFSNKELEQKYASLDALKTAEVLQPFLQWIRKQKGDRVFRTVDANRRSKRR